MMDKLIENVIISSPSLVGGIVVLILMLKHSASLQRANESIAKAFVEAVRSQAEQCHDVQKESVQVMRETTGAIAQLSTTVSSNDATLREMRDFLAFIRRNPHIKP